MRIRKFDYKLIVTTFIWLFFAVFITEQPAYASDVSLDVKISSVSVRSGDTVEITVGLISSSEAISSYSYTISYDSSLLEPAGALDEVYDGCVSYSGTGDGTTEPQVMTFVFTAVSPGTASIETAATEILLNSGDSATAAPSYNSVTISDEAISDTTDIDTSLTGTSSAQGAYTPNDDETMTDDETDIPTEDEVGTLTEAEAEAPEGTLVSLHSSSILYYVLPKPDSVDVPTSYLPVTISLNDVDVKAYKRATDNDTVLLYAEDIDGNQGWYFFNVSDGSFLSSEDLISSDSAIGSFITEYKFIIMLIAIIILVILVVVIVMLAVSFRNVIKDYEARIKKLKSNDPAQNTPDDNVSEDIPTIGDKALFPSDEDIHESNADTVTGKDSSAVDTDIKKSLEEIDMALKSADKYKRRS